MNLGLVMGGGGIVGIAWELGVLAALQESAGLDPTAAAVIVGSSAGSVAGAQAALGKDLRALVDRQLTTAQVPSGEDAAAPPAPRAMPQAIIEMMMSDAGSMEERAARVGRLAIEAALPMDEAAYVASFEGFLGTDDWPTTDLRVTTAEAETGRSVLWSRANGIGLIRAVASSCAIPGFFPPVAFGDKHYVDGPRGGFMAQLASDKALDAIVFVGPNAALPPQFARQAELEELATDGMPVVMITGGQVLADIGMNLMDPRLRARAAEAGLTDGHDAALEVKQLLGNGG